MGSAESQGSGEDHRPHGFAIVPDWMFTVIPGLTHKGLRLLLGLLRYANRKGQCHPSRDLLHKVTGVSPRHFAEAFKEIEKAGLAARHRFKRPQDRWPMWHYTVAMRGPMRSPIGETATTPMRSSIGERDGQNPRIGASPSPNRGGVHSPIGENESPVGLRRTIPGNIPGNRPENTPQTPQRGAGVALASPGGKGPEVSNEKRIETLVAFFEARVLGGGVIEPRFVEMARKGKNAWPEPMIAEAVRIIGARGDSQGQEERDG